MNEHKLSFDTVDVAERDANRANLLCKALLAILMMVFAVGCRDQPSAEEVGIEKAPHAEPKARYVVDGHEAPRAAFWAYDCVPTYETSDTYEIASNTKLQFLPVVSGAETGAGVRLELVSKDATISLGEFQSHYLGIKDGGRISDYTKLMDCVVQVDLSAHAGKVGTFRWTPLGGGERAETSIGFIKIIESKSASKPPSILMICSDTHRADFATEGDGPELMPRLTALRAEAMTYRRAYSNASWTLPSITSTMTGKFPRFHRTGQRTGMERRPQDLASIENRRGEFWLDWPPFIRHFRAFPSSGVMTFTDILKENGYSTVWISGNLFYSVSGLEKYGPELIMDARNMHGTDLNDMAFRMMDELSPEQPVFMLVHYLDVHQYRHWVLGPRFPGKWPMQIPREDFIEGYRESVRHSDEFLGQLLDRWKAQYGFENSLIIFWSDHGEHLRDPGYMEPGDWPAYQAATGASEDDKPPFYDHGNSMDEVLLHVPLIVRYPDSYQMRGESLANVSLVDLFPTIMDVAGVNTGEYRADGVSLVGRADGGGSGPIFADFQLGGHELSSVRVDNFKYVLRLDEAGGVTARHLVDTQLEFDERGELGQRIEDGETTARLERMFVDYSRESARQTEGMTSDVEMDVERDLQSLKDAGYVAK